MKIREDDKSQVDAFSQDQSQTYTCGTDFSELASSIQVSKVYLRPYCQIYSGYLSLSCLHPVDEKVYKLNQHRRTCSQCGDNSSNPVVANQFPLCTMCREKGWPLKAFTVIAKKMYAKKVKVGNDVEEANAEGNEAMDTHENNENDNDDNNEMNECVDDEDSIENENEDVSSTSQDTNSASAIVESDLVIGSKKRNQRSKKTATNNLVCNSDTDFLQMHGSEELSSLPCNDIGNRELLKKLENKARNR